MSDFSKDVADRLKRKEENECLAAQKIIQVYDVSKDTT